MRLSQVENGHAICRYRTGIDIFGNRDDAILDDKLPAYYIFWLASQCSRPPAGIE